MITARLTPPNQQHLKASLRQVLTSSMLHFVIKVTKVQSLKYRHFATPITQSLGQTQNLQVNFSKVTETTFDRLCSITYAANHIVHWKKFERYFFQRKKSNS